MIVLFTDFGWRGPYVAQLINVLHRRAAEVPVLNLFCDAPSFNPYTSAHLLDAYWHEFAEGTVFLCVVDPGVGTAQRQPVVVRVDGRWFVGPGNGLFDVVAARGQWAEFYEISWRPEHLSASFHGRDLFAPVAAHLARGGDVHDVARPLAMVLGNCAGDDLWAIIYTDHFGNAVSGIRAAAVPGFAKLRIEDAVFSRARTFGEVPKGHAFYYENSNGLIEFARNCGSFVELTHVSVGSLIQLERECS